MKSEGKEKEEKGREQELTGEELAKRIHVENLCSIRDMFTDSWSWQSFVLSWGVLTIFFYWNYEMKYSCYQHSIVILGWLAYWVVVAKSPLDKKKSEIIVFKNKLSKPTSPCWMRKALSDCGLTWWVFELHLDRQAWVIKLYIAFDFFFWFHVYTVILRTLVRFETNFIWLQLERNRSEE